MKTHSFRIIMLVLAIFVGLPSSRAELLIYQTRTKVAGSGNEFEYKFSARGFLVWDLDTDEYASLAYYTSINGVRRYDVSTGTLLTAQVTALRGRSFTVFTGVGADDGVFSMGTERGQNTTLKHATMSTVSRPRTFKGTTHYLNTNAPTRTVDSSFTRVYSQARTMAANDDGMTVDDMVASLGAELEWLGYIED